ncbi:MAG: hypothetical protein H0U71_08000 [Gammaproteobacteria bacterium]|nr:hypothetical protein [Gammaproteobacteria bacterium]
MVSRYGISKTPIIFSGTKSIDAVSSLRGLKDLFFHSNTVLISLQNGLGTENDLRMASSIFDSSVRIWCFTSKGRCLLLIRGHQMNLGT